MQYFLILWNHYIGQPHKLELGIKYYMYLFLFIDNFINYDHLIFLSPLFLDCSNNLTRTS